MDNQDCEAHFLCLVVDILLPVEQIQELDLENLGLQMDILHLEEDNQILEVDTQCSHYLAKDIESVLVVADIQGSRYLKEGRDSVPAEGDNFVP